MRGVSDDLPRPAVLRQRVLRALGIVGGYVTAVLVLTWPAVWRPLQTLIGVADTDTADTAWLHRAFADSFPALRADRLAAPEGLELTAIIPNFVDHALAAPLVATLPFPLADTVFVWGVMLTNALAAHLVGRAWTGRDGAGWLCGLGLLCAEPVLRELALGHAPQALVAPLVLGLLFLQRATEKRTLLWMGLAGGVLGLAGLTYWFQLAFGAALLLPFALYAAMDDRRAFSALTGTAVIALGIVVGPFLSVLMAAPELASVQPPAVADPRVAAVPDAAKLAATHGTDLLWPFRAWPAALSNRLSLVAVVAAGMGAWTMGWRKAWPWVAAAVLGGVLLLGPVLQIGGEVVTVGGSVIPLPGDWLAVGPLARLHWPERWGLVVALALLPLMARAPRAGLLAPLVLLETLVLSSNAPLPGWYVGGWERWNEVPNGTYLAVPLAESVADEALADRVRSSHALGWRSSEIRLANAMNLPPGVVGPEVTGEVATWADALCRSGVADGLALDALARDGLDGIVLDVSPGGPTQPADRARFEEALSPVLGAPADLGSVLLWRVDGGLPAGLPDAEAWRAALRARATGPRRGPALCGQR